MLRTCFRAEEFAIDFLQILKRVASVVNKHPFVVFREIAAVPVNLGAQFSNGSRDMIASFGL